MSNNLKIIATSDLHTILPDIPSCDILLLGGDYLPDYPRSPYRIDLQTKWVREMFIPWLGTILAKHIVIIAGNHDYLFAQPDFAQLINELPINCHYLLDEIIELEGVKIFGTPWTPTFFDWSFMKDDHELDYHWANLDLKPVDIILSHGPAYGILDQVPDGNRIRLTGSQAQHNLIKRLKPKLQVCGHIHEGQGRAVDFKGTKFVNVALMDPHYIPTNTVCEISWPSLDINWPQVQSTRTINKEF